MTKAKKEVRPGGESSKRILGTYPTLRKSEKKVADYILHSPEIALHLPITQLAKNLNLSEASISRFCRSIGYGGYNDFKMALAKDAFSGTVNNIPTEIRKTDTISTLIHKTSRFFVGVLQEMPERLNHDHLLKAINAIIQANRLLIYGIGGSGAVARAAHHFFLKTGLPCSVYDDGYMQIVSAATLRQGDVAIGISHSGSTLDVVNACKIAKMNGAITIAVTSDVQSPLSEQCDIVLRTTSHEIPLYGEFMRARIGQLFIVDLLYIGIVFTLGDQARKNLENTARAVKEYY